MWLKIHHKLTSIQINIAKQLVYIKYQVLKTDQWYKMYAYFVYRNWLAHMINSFLISDKSLEKFITISHWQHAKTFLLCLIVALLHKIQPKCIYKEMFYRQKIHIQAVITFTQETFWARFSITKVSFAHWSTLQLFIVKPSKWRHCYFSVSH